MTYYAKVPKYKLVGFMSDYSLQHNLLNDNKKAITPSFLNKMNKYELLKFMMAKVPEKDMPEHEKLDTYQNTRSFNFEKTIGLERLTKKQKEAIDWDNPANITNPYVGRQNIVDKDKAIIELLTHQKKFLQGFLIGNLRCAIAFHGVGSGKTLTAVATANMYLQLYPKNKVIVITPSARYYSTL